MKNPSILIFSQAMELGGVERSLLGLLDAIDYDRYDVDLFLMRHSGELMPYLNPKANLLPEIPQYASLAVPMVSLVKSGQLGVLCGRLEQQYAPAISAKSEGLCFLAHGEDAIPGVF